MLRIHIVNSIKGGCGKSTVCLHLANYLNQQCTSPTIVDIDLCGTSWYNNYKHCLKETPQKGDYHFINDLIDNFDETINSHYMFSIKTDTNTDDEDKHLNNDIKICMADPERNTQIEDVELDLFEHAIYKLIMSFFSETGKHTFTDTSSELEKNKEKNIDIILDMPPGYEAHAERIVNHLLLDVNSPLYRKIKKDEIKYKVFLYMVTGLNSSCIEHNIGYIKKLFLNHSISEDMYDHLTKDNIFFIINDCTALLPNIKNIDPSTIKENIDGHINQILSEIDKKGNNTKITTQLLEHISSMSTAQIKEFLGPNNESDTLDISSKEYSAFNTLFNSFGLGVPDNNSDEKQKKKGSEKDEKSALLQYTDKTQ